MKDNSNSAIFNSIYNALRLSKISLPQPENFAMMPIKDYLEKIGLQSLLRVSYESRENN